MSHLRKAEWEVAPIPTHAQAREMIERLHYSQSCANTSTYRHGLYRAGDVWNLHGVAMWQPPIIGAARAVAGEEWRGVLSLSRLVLDPEVPTNGASFLLGRSMRLLDRERWPWLVTYADTNLGHTGAIYAATNWQRVGEVPAGDVWVGPDGAHRSRRRGNRTWTRAEMVEAGFTRMPTQPKVKFIHTQGVRHAS